MNSVLSIFISVLLVSIVSIHLTSSASFPNPPPFPPPNASPDDWTTFWKLLHNYYAIIARPRLIKHNFFLLILNIHISFYIGLVNDMIQNSCNRSIPNF